MPDTDAPSRTDLAFAPGERVNLPVPVPRPSEIARDAGESWLARVLRSVFGWKPGSIRADLEVVLKAGAPEETGFSPEERTMLRNILGMRERRIDDVMVPRADIVAVQKDISIGELLKTFEGAGHSRLVVYDDTLDDPVGMVHIRDLIAHMVKKATVDPDAKPRRKKPFPAGLDLRAVDLAVPLSATGIVRDILFVPPSMPTGDLLTKMQATRVHLALVIDEYGGTDGIVSIEDLVEQIVGEIEDEHDEDELPSVVRQHDGSFLADARANLEDVIATVGTEFEVGDVADEVDTLGGYLVTRVGRLPARGEVVQGPNGFEIEVLDADPRRIKRVRITHGKPGESRPERIRRRDGRADASLGPNSDPGAPSS
ncbi:MAG: hemolysin family protein [Xanthobacteraceae bacterium]|nr:hemolysin family protein [Xanthobacteraceae bacterium]PWB64903.1 MAG: magnesium/cobalt efflux protein [Bradyrhizobiaceae bacterium]